MSYSVPLSPASSRLQHSLRARDLQLMTPSRRQLRRLDVSFEKLFDEFAPAGHWNCWPVRWSSSPNIRACRTRRFVGG
jgi:hypothetical protein